MTRALLRFVRSEIPMGLLFAVNVAMATLGSWLAAFAAGFLLWLEVTDRRVHIDLTLPIRREDDRSE